MFDLVPTSCNKHISSIYAQLGHPQIDFHSFWDVYNQLRDAVDAEFLFDSSTGTFPEEHTSTPDDDPNITKLPLSHLRACQFGEDGVPAGETIEEGEADHFPTPSLLLSDPFLSSEVSEHRARLREEGSGMAPQILLYMSTHISLDDDLVVEFTDDEADEIY